MPEPVHRLGADGPAPRCVPAGEDGGAGSPEPSGRPTVGDMDAASDLVRDIVAGGGLSDPHWRAAFEAVRRETFVPYFYPFMPGREDERLGRDDPDPGRRAQWRAGVYADVPLATHVRDGVTISTSSQPSLMARMLEQLDVRDGMNVLEIGTGTGYNAALLAHRLGDAHVTTVDLESVITDAARRRLDEAGHRPRVVTGDGALGCPEHAPYDRVVATCAVSSIPGAWVEQCAPEALVLAPVATGLLALRVRDSGFATGRFGPTPAFFVPLRGATPPGPQAPYPSGLPGHAVRSDSFRFLLALSAGHLTPHDAYVLWSEENRPSRERYGVTVRDGEQWAWLDEPDGAHTWPLGAEDGPET